ncbi:response regulator [Loktanella sp. DJP18]|uniref:response regulator n=1 Tax=Loktanella sp. DJP18 TaxID=3409788 RepID=UPI003BB6B522
MDTQPAPIHPCPLRVLLVQSQLELGRVWQRHMQRQGVSVELCRDADAALEALESQVFDVVVLDLVLEEGNGLTVADMAAFRHPQASVICVTDASFFSDGSIFNHCATAGLTLNRTTPPDELTAIVAHYGERSAALGR